VANRLSSPETLAALVKDLDSIGVQVALSADNMSGERLQRALEVVRNSPDRDRVRILTGISFQGVGPGWAEKAVAQLEADVKAGAVGVGEIGKGLGLTTRKADGTRLRIDDPDLDPVWAACARLNIPVFIHTADPPEFFQPLDYHNERWLELALFPDRRWMTGEYPTIEELFAERDRLFRRHPKTRFVAAHLGWHGSDLARLGRLFDELPNVSAELGAVLYELGRQPRTARAFFVKYQDRLLFGKDTFAPSEFPYYWRVFETADEYFDYYRDYHAFWKLYGLDLPDEVLRKIYYQNAVRITPGLPQGGWPK
jgi:predicted TIM-barrel fold metal-dependent hydrolase